MAVKQHTDIYSIPCSSHSPSQNTSPRKTKNISLINHCFYFLKEKKNSQNTLIDEMEATVIKQKKRLGYRVEVIKSDALILKVGVHACKQQKLLKPKNYL